MSWNNMINPKVDGICNAHCYTKGIMFPHFYFVRIMLFVLFFTMFFDNFLCVCVFFLAKCFLLFCFSQCSWQFFIVLFFGEKCLLFCSLQCYWQIFILFFLQNNVLHFVLDNVFDWFVSTNMSLLFFTIWFQ